MEDYSKPLGKLNPEEECYFCGEFLRGIVLDNCEGDFRFLPKFKSAHLECYIEEAVKQSIKKYLKNKK